MTVWCHLPTIFNRPLALRFAGLLALTVALTTTLVFGVPTHALAGTNATLSFQGRLAYSSGGAVADGHYNIQFKIYEGGSGTSAGNPGGTLKWTESHINNGGTAGVEVKNGYMSATLGSVNPFGTNVDWNQDTIWLSMNIAGSSASCTTFGSAPCAADGEMLPMQRMTAVPQALNSNAVGGKTVDKLVQLGQGVQNDASNSSSSIFINKTGTAGNFLQLQNAGENALTVTSYGDIALGSATNHTIEVAPSSSDTAGKYLVVKSGDGGAGSGSSGGVLSLQGGSAGGTNGNGGDVQIEAGAKTGTGINGTIYIGSIQTSTIQIGSASSGLSQTIVVGNENNGGTQNVAVGSGAGAGAGSTTIQAKNSVIIATDGTTRATFSNTSNTVYFGNGASSISPNDFTIQSTNSAADGVGGGSLTLRGGDVTVGNGNGGNVVISGGSGNGTGVSGSVILNTPTFSTVTDDANCYSGGAVVASSCTIATSSINNSAAVLVGFSTTNQTATLPNPTITTAGRVMYIMAADGSKDFTLSMNGGGTDNQIIMRQNKAVTMMWNGVDWIVAGASSSTALQDSLDSSTGLLNVQVGNGADDGTTSLLKLDKSASTPGATQNDALLGSMYYDIGLGKVQCYEADGWGKCGASPDYFVTMSPEYANAVTNSAGIGTMTSDICSDTLNINDGSSSQPTICGTNETYNFYKWTSAETTDQTKSIYVTYHLPSTFKNFVPGATSLMGRTNNSDSTVAYQIYRNNSSNGLTACGSAVPVSTGSQSTWQKAIADNAEDPSDCDFAAGDSIVFRINFTAKDNANAYVSNLDFAFSNN